MTKSANAKANKNKKIKKKKSSLKKPALSKKTNSTHNNCSATKPNTNKTIGCSVKELKLISTKVKTLSPEAIRVERCNLLKDLRIQQHFLCDFNKLIPNVTKQISLFPQFIEKFEQLELDNILKWEPLRIFGDGK